MARRLAQQRVTSSDLEWSFHASRAISAVAELLVASRPMQHSVCICNNAVSPDNAGRGQELMGEDVSTFLPFSPLPFLLPLPFHIPFLLLHFPPLRIRFP